MHVLGIADGPDASAALCIDDRLAAFERQASFDARTRERSFPWDAAVDVLRRAGSRKSDVRAIAIAGRWTPPLALRKQPLLRRLAASSFSATLDLGVFYQAMLRQTGMGALQADNAADWLAWKLGTRGFRGQLTLVDIHTALANAVYRLQDRDDVLICTLHPLGDGVSLAFHRAAFGQIDRVFDQKGFSALHVHLHRCAERLECASLSELWALAGNAEPDAATVEALNPLLHAATDRLSRAAYPLPSQRRGTRCLTHVSRPVAAASVRENLRRAIRAVLQHHLSIHGTRHLLLAGEGFADPVLRATLELDVDSVGSLADPGYGALAVGAAAYAAGLPMCSAEPTAIDPEVRTAPDVDAVVSALEGERPVYRFSGRSVVDPWRTGDRCVWTRGPNSTPAKPGSLLAQVTERVGPVQLHPLRFAGKPVNRLSQVQTLARGVDGWVAAGP